MTNWVKASPIAGPNLEEWVNLDLVERMYVEPHHPSSLEGKPPRVHKRTMLMFAGGAKGYSEPLNHFLPLLVSPEGM